MNPLQLLLPVRQMRQREALPLADSLRDLDSATLLVNDTYFFRCRMCRIWEHEEAEGPSLGEWQRFLRELRGVVGHKLVDPDVLRRFRVTLVGGEPLASEATYSILGHAAELGFHAALHTNGWLLTQKAMARLVRNGLSSLTFSLDSPDPEVHDTFRGMPGSYRRVLAAVDAAPAGLGITLTCILHEGTYRQALRMADWVAEHPKIRRVQFSAITEPFGASFRGPWQEHPGYRDLWPQDADAVCRVLDGLIERRSRYGDRIVNPPDLLSAYKRYFRDPGRFILAGRACHVDRTLTVTSRGDLVLCFHKGAIGNIRKQTLSAMLASQEAARARAAIRGCSDPCHQMVNCGPEYFEEAGR